MGRDPSGIGHFLSPGEACETMIGPLQPSLDSMARPYTDKNELAVKGLDGRIRQKNTVPPGNDPFPPRDRT